MANPRSFSIGVDNFLNLVRPHGRPSTSFPLGLSGNDTRRGSTESLHQWFVRLVDKYCDGDPTLVGAEDNIAIFANFGWQKDVLRYASVPTLIVIDGTLVDFYRGETQSIGKVSRS